VLGGRVESSRILRDTYLPFRLGERVLLFLQMNGQDDFPFVRFHQGILRFRARGPGGTMPDLNQPDTCATCGRVVVNGRDRVVTAISFELMVPTTVVSTVVPADQTGLDCGMMRYSTMTFDSLNVPRFVDRSGRRSGQADE
jgi:hypothetical protein